MAGSTNIFFFTKLYNLVFSNWYLVTLGYAQSIVNSMSTVVPLKVHSLNTITALPLWYYVTHAVSFTLLKHGIY